MVRLIVQFRMVETAILPQARETDDGGPKRGTADQSRRSVPGRPVGSLRARMGCFRPEFGYNQGREFQKELVAINQPVGDSRMATSMEELKAELAGLTEQERAELAHFLLISLDGAGAGDDADTDVEAAWDAELARRADEIQQGTAVGKPADQVFAELREKYA